jgi:tetratricopeptide (TPR) repeat protein
MKLKLLNKSWICCLLLQGFVCVRLDLPANAGETKPDSPKIYKAVNAFARSAFEKGKRLLSQGKVPEAIAEWNTIIPYMRDSSKFKADLEEVQQNYLQAEAAKKSAAAAADKDRDTKVSPLDAFDVLLSETNNKLKAEVRDANVRKQKAESSILVKQKFVLATFEKGNALYNKDKISEAISEWVRLIPYLDDEELKSAIRTARTNCNLSEQAKRSADEAESKNDQARFRSPEDLNRLLIDAAGKVKIQMEQSKAQETKAPMDLGTGRVGGIPLKKGEVEESAR